MRLGYKNDHKRDRNFKMLEYFNNKSKIVRITLFTKFPCFDVGNKIELQNFSKTSWILCITSKRSNDIKLTLKKFYIFISHCPKKYQFKRINKC